MAVFDVFNPLANVTPRFTEEQLEEFVGWFDGNAKPLLTIDNGEPINVITIEQLLDFLQLKKLHRRSFHYPSYGEIMKEAENLKAGVLRILTKEQFIYMLNKWVFEPEIKHELLLAFQVFDTEKRSFLEIDEIKTIMTSYGDVMSQDEVREMLRDANVRGDGNVFFEDFVESIFSLAPELYQLKTDYLYDNPDEDPSVPSEPKSEPEPKEIPPTPQLEPEPEETPPPPQPPAKKNEVKKGKK